MAAILLSTKNGGRFLATQINSIREQTHRCGIYWRDDHSQDDTCLIAKTLGLSSDDNGHAIGITRSYASLLHRAWNDDHHYFGLADQDDIWHHDKIERAVNALQGLAHPALYCARQTLVDETLKRIGSSPEFHEPIGFPAALTQNVASGCTIVMNRPAADLVRRTWYDQPYHDWWCYLIVTAAGGAVITDSTEVMLYRQHPGNTIGGQPRYIQRAINAVRRGPMAFMQVFRQHVTALHRHEMLLSDEARDQLAVIQDALTNGPRAKLRALRLPGFHRQTLSENLLFRLWFLVG